MQHTEQEIIEHCAKLLWGFNYVQEKYEFELDLKTKYYKRINDGSFEDIHITESVDEADSFSIPKGLCDEDKFLCALFLYIYKFEYITSKVLKDMYGWSKYRCMKVRKNLPIVKTYTYIGERGWYIDSDILDKIWKLQDKNKSCIGCRVLFKSLFGKAYRCSLIEDTPCPESLHCQYIKLHVTESFNNFWK